MVDNLEKVIRIEGAREIISHTMNGICSHDSRPPCGIYFKAIGVRTNSGCWTLEISALVYFDNYYLLKVIGASKGCRPENGVINNFLIRCTNLPPMVTAIPDIFGQTRCSERADTSSTAVQRLKFRSTLSASFGPARK